MANTPIEQAVEAAIKYFDAKINRLEFGFQCAKEERELRDGLTALRGMVEPPTASDGGELADVEWLEGQGIPEAFASESHRGLAYLDHPIRLVMQANGGGFGLVKSPTRRAVRLLVEALGGGE